MVPSFTKTSKRWVLHYNNRGSIQNFSEGAVKRMCIGPCPPGGVGVGSPRKLLKFTCSEDASGGPKMATNELLSIKKISTSILGGGGGSQCPPPPSV